jgi:hypothetical protein
MMREGTELAETMIFIQRALEEKKIDGDLAARANRYLDDRGGLSFVCQFVEGEYDEKLMDLAGEVARAIGK